VPRQIRTTRHPRRCDTSVSLLRRPLPYGVRWLRRQSASARYADPLTALQLESTTNDDFLDWRDRLRPGRLPRTVNRLVRAVTAGLNRAHRLGHIGNPAAWRLEALPDDDESETAVFLSPLQRKQLIASASSEAGTFMLGLEFSGARPKELAEATAADFDGASVKLSHRKGRPPKIAFQICCVGRRRGGVLWISSARQVSDGPPRHDSRWKTMASRSVGRTDSLRHRDSQ